MVVLHHSRLIFWRVVGASLLVLLDVCLNRLWQRSLESLGIAEPATYAETRACKDQTTHAGRLRRHVVDAQHRSPRMAEDVYLREIKCRSKPRHLVDEPVYPPQFFLSRVV